MECSLAWNRGRISLASNLRILWWYSQNHLITFVLDRYLDIREKVVYGVDSVVCLRNCSALVKKDYFQTFLWGQVFWSQKAVKMCCRPSSLNIPFARMDSLGHNFSSRNSTCLTYPDYQTTRSLIDDCFAPDITIGGQDDQGYYCQLNFNYLYLTGYSAALPCSTNKSHRDCSLLTREKCCKRCSFAIHYLQI